MPDQPPLHRRWHPPKQERRGTASQRGYGTQWRKLRAAHLSTNPSCVECLKFNLVVPATVVDHVIPHHGDEALLYDPANLRSLCGQCHNRATATYDGGFGNPTQPKPDGTHGKDPTRLF